MAVATAQSLVYSHVNAASISFTLGSIPTVGNLLVVAFMGNDNFTTYPSGWTQVVADSSLTESSIYLFYRVVQMGDNVGPYTWAGSASGYDTQGWIGEFSGSSGTITTYQEGNSTYTQGSPNTLACYGSVSANVGDLIYAMFNVHTNYGATDGTDTINSGFTVIQHGLYQLNGSSTQTQVVGKLSVTTAGSYGPTCTMTGTQSGGNAAQSSIVFIIPAAPIVVNFTDNSPNLSDSLATAYMPPGTIQVADAISGTTATEPLTLTWPLGAPNTGDVLLAVAIGQYGYAVSPPTNWTTLYSNNSSWGYALFWRVAASGTDTANVTFTNGSGHNLIVSMVRIINASSSTPQWSVATSDSTPVNPPSIVPTKVGALVLGMFCGAPLITASFTSAGYTTQTSSVQGAGNYCTFVETRNTLTMDTTTAITTLGTLSGTSDYYGFEVIVAPGGAVLQFNDTSAAITDVFVLNPSIVAIGFFDTLGGMSVVGPTDSLSIQAGTGFATLTFTDTSHSLSDTVSVVYGNPLTFSDTAFLLTDVFLLLAAPPMVANLNFSDALTGFDALNLAITASSVMFGETGPSGYDMVRLQTTGGFSSSNQVYFPFGPSLNT